MLARQAAQFRQVGDQGRGRGRADAGHRLQQVVLGAPHRTGLHAVAQVGVGRLEALLEEVDVGLHVALDAVPRQRQAVPLRGQHLDELPAAGHQRGQILLRGVG